MAHRSTTTTLLFCLAALLGAILIPSVEGAWIPHNIPSAERPFKQARHPNPLSTLAVRGDPLNNQKEYNPSFGPHIQLEPTQPPKSHQPEAKGLVPIWSPRPKAPSAGARPADAASKGLSPLAPQGDQFREESERHGFVTSFPDLVPTLKKSAPPAQQESRLAVGFPKIKGIPEKTTPGRRRRSVVVGEKEKEDGAQRPLGRRGEEVQVVVGRVWV
ncbi:hypothetical protein B0T14DRAFT_317937 [Immersiella caudata]|uniref:Uncharacterized protein n=1 Tax=Immersiella caudata TaxID=314043 RepID=A0AA39U3L4_9PEZI|nr:hypothetical protein B0T14DRAFT_317937 [Immersiella caudata]